MNFMNINLSIRIESGACLHSLPLYCALLSIIQGSKKLLAPEHHTAKHCCGGRAPRLLTSLLHKLKANQPSPAPKMKSGNLPILA